LLIQIKSIIRCNVVQLSEYFLNLIPSPIRGGLGRGDIKLPLPLAPSQREGDINKNGTTMR
jgi:hypothetical protein